MYNNPIYAQPQQPAHMVNRPIYSNMMQTTYAGLRGRPVASIEEARASIIDFDGSVFYFPDIANRKIYTKQVNMDGTASLCVYELQELPQIDNQQFITREEFEAVIESLRQSTTMATAPSHVLEVPAGKPADAGVVLNF